MFARANNSISWVPSPTRPSGQGSACTEVCSRKQNCLRAQRIPFCTRKGIWLTSKITTGKATGILFRDKMSRRQSLHVQRIVLLAARLSARDDKFLAWDGIWSLNRPRARTIPWGEPDKFRLAPKFVPGKKTVCPDRQLGRLIHKTSLRNDVSPPNVLM